MPVAGKEIVKKVILPSYPENDQGWVDLVINPKVDAWENLPENSEDVGITIMARLIKDWNFTDEQGNKLEINEDNVRKALSVFDIATLSEEMGITKLSLSDSKKNP